MNTNWTFIQRLFHNLFLNVKSKLACAIHIVKDGVRDIFQTIFTILFVEGRVEQKVADNFLGSLAAFVVTICLGSIVKLFYIPKIPSWVNPPIQFLVAGGALSGLLIALISWQECYGWLVPKETKNKKSPYMLFFSGMLILILGTTMFLVLPLALVSAFILSYQVPVKLKEAGLISPIRIRLSFSIIVTFYGIILLRRFLLLVQKWAHYIIQKRNNISVSITQTRIIKYILSLGVTLIILYLNFQEIFEPFIFSFIPTLLLWNFLNMAWWEKADRNEITWVKALRYSLISLPFLFGAFYGLAHAFVWLI